MCRALNRVSEESLCLAALQPLLLESSRSTMATHSPSSNSPTTPCSRSISAAGSVLHHTQHLTTMSNMQGKRLEYSRTRFIASAAQVFRPGLLSLSLSRARASQRLGVYSVTICYNVSEMFAVIVRELHWSGEALGLLIYSRRVLGATNRC